MVSGGNTVVGTGAVSLDASASADPDGERGSLTIQWQCTPPAGEGTPEGGCRTADGSALVLPPGPLVSVELEGTAAGRNYTLSVSVSKEPRTAVASVWLVVRANVRLPVISVQGLSQSKVNPLDKLTLIASVDSASPTTLRTNWTVVGPPALLDLLSRPGVAGTDLSSQSLVILPGSLPPKSTVQFRISAADSRGSSSADISVPVSGVPIGLGKPLGDISVTPVSGFGMNTSFTATCSDWIDEDLPLTYGFAYNVSGGDGGGFVALRDYKPLVRSRLTLSAYTRSLLLACSLKVRYECAAPESK